MGFIEELRRRRDQQESSRVLEEAEKIAIERVRILQERDKNRPQWEEAKRQFNQSGLLVVLKKAIEFKTAESYYIDPENFDDMIRWNFDVGTPHFHAELHIKTTIKGHDDHYYVGGYSNKITTKYLGIKVDKTGAIEFRGKGLFGHSKFVRVSKVKWQGNVGVLEDALGRVYHHPRAAERSEMIDNPVFDRYFAIFEKKFDSEHKESGV